MITIIILLILAGISISSLTQTGLFKKAQDASNRTKEASAKEKVAILMNEYFMARETDGTELNTFLTDKKKDKEIDKFVDNRDGTVTIEVDKYEVKVKKDDMSIISAEKEGESAEKTEISKDKDPAKSYVANYADKEGDGTVDGIIFADLVTGATGDGQWTNDDGNYTIPQIAASDSKSYYISKETYEGPFGPGKVISPIAGTTGEDRFYIMALSDIDGKVDGTQYDWYNSANEKMSDWATYTSKDFGKGKENTDKMIKKWNDQGETKEYSPYYGAQNSDDKYKDLWGQITTEVSKGWFVPSIAEWSAFGGEIAEKMDITALNYDQFKLSSWYWSSSQYDARDAWCTCFYDTFIWYGVVHTYTYVRLATTF